jgi:hypothetical protein
VKLFYRFGVEVQAYLLLCTVPFKNLSEQYISLLNLNNAVLYFLTSCYFSINCGYIVERRKLSAITKLIFGSIWEVFLVVFFTF